MANDNRGPENIADILGRLFTSRGWGRKNDRLRLESAWAEAAGPALLPDTRVLAIRRGVLEVEVKNAVLLQELTQYHTVIAFDKTAELVGAYATKGRKLYVEGRLEYRTYKDRDGHEREAAEIVAHDVQFLDSKREVPAADNEALDRTDMPA